MLRRTNTGQVTRAEPGVVDLVEIIPSYVDELILQTVQDTHRAWSSRAYGAVNSATGGAAIGPQRLHRAISETVFGAVRVGVVGGATLAGALSGLMSHRGLTGPRSSVVHSALNGLLGDRLDAGASVLSIGMSVRKDGQDIPPAELEGAFPAATGRIVVFLHGLGEHDAHWSQGGARGSSYPEAVARAGWTPVVLRYNTGLSLTANGTALAQLLEEVYDDWPVPLERIALVGHSLGGLVARAGCAVGSTRSTGWRGLVTDMITLGTPHLGADLARLVQIGSKSLARLPETAAFARILDVRSVGIVELSSGLGADENATDIRHRLVSGSLPGAWGMLFGDLMVRQGSATGKGGGAELFPDAEALHLDGVGHLELLNHAEVETALLRWLE